MRYLACVLFLSTLSLVAAPARAGENTESSGKIQKLPSTLSGRWYTPDKLYSNVWGLREINPTNGTALIDFWSTQPACSMHGEHVSLRSDGETLIGTVQFRTKRICPTRFEVILKKVPGTDEWVGRLQADISSNYPYVETLVR